MEIRQIAASDQESISQCVKMAESNYLDNIVLLGDLYPPCNKLTDVSGELEFVFCALSFNLLSYKQQRLFH